MPAKAHQALWAELSDRLYQRFGGDVYERWFSHLLVLSSQGEELRLGVANEFMRDWVERYYGAVLREELMRLDVGPRTVTLLVEPDRFAAARREQEQIFGSDDRERRRSAPPAGELGASLGAGPANGGGGRSTETRLESYVVGVNNHLGHSATRQVQERLGELFNPLFLHGPSGVGKTHLLKGLLSAVRGTDRLQHESFKTSGRVPGRLKAKYITAEEFTNQFIQSLRGGSLSKFRQRFRSLDLLLLDDIQAFLGKEKTQQEFLYTFNAIVENRCQVAIASNSAPRDLQGIERGLVTRFLSGLVVSIKPPERHSRVVILRQEASRLQTCFDDEVIQHVAETIRGTARELKGAMMRLNLHAEVEGKLTTDRVRELIADFIYEKQRHVDLGKIQNVVARHFSLPAASLASRSQRRRDVLARQVAMFLARQYTGASLAEIGRHFGNRRHATVQSAVLRVQHLLNNDQHFVREMDDVVEALLH